VKIIYVIFNRNGMHAKHVANEHQTIDIQMEVAIQETPDDPINKPRIIMEGKAEAELADATVTIGYKNLLWEIALCKKRSEKPYVGFIAGVFVCLGVFLNNIIWVFNDEISAILDSFSTKDHVGF